MQLISAFVAGLLFGGGLLLSRMTNPQNVLAFLDVAGAWRPALLYTMAAAVAVAFPAFWLARRSRHSWLGLPTDLPDRFRFDLPLIFGSAIFGVGWGLSGVCPGPALLLLSRANGDAITFALALAIGMLGADHWRRRTRVAAPPSPAKAAVN
jgi:uncharacterized membrane protein YedE/YeeE